MSILKYFHLSVEETDKKLPDPHGSLCKEVPSSSIEKANASVAPIIERQESGKRGPYLILTPAQRYGIGRRAAEHGVTATLRYYSRQFPELPLKEASVRRLKDEYRANLKKPGGNSSRDTSGLEVQELPCKKAGKPLLLGEELDKQVREYVKYLRERGAVVNSAIVIAAAEGIVMNKDSNLLACNGGGINLTKYWAKSLLRRMGMVKRRVSSKSKVNVEEFDILKEEFLLNIRNVVSLDEIPPALIVNWDQTAIHYVPVSSWTMETEGLKRIEVAGKDDKRQITAVFGASMEGDFLPVQLVYQGKTTRCLPQVEFPVGWDITYSENHWSNENTMKHYIDNIILPYIRKKRDDLKLPHDYPALTFFDNFKGQCTPPLLQILDDNHINVLLIPPNCTDKLQPLDISVNKAAKEFMCREFQKWYAQQVYDQLQGNSETASVDLRLTIVKPLGAQWLISLCDYFKGKPDIVRNGFRYIKDYLDNDVHS